MRLIIALYAHGRVSAPKAVMLQGGKFASWTIASEDADYATDGLRIRRLHIAFGSMPQELRRATMALQGNCLYRK